MLNKIINISELFCTQSLITRQAARNLFEIISHSNENIIVLDFSKIEYATRSFFDEFNSFESQFKLLGKNVELSNIKDSLFTLFKLVKEKSKSMSSISYSSVANAKIINI